MNGVLPVYKEAGMTSRQITSAVRRIMGGCKAGHAGTLDPMAEGVLPVLLGSATRLSDLLPEDKIYRVTFVLGISTDTGDTTGNILSAENITLPYGEVEKAALSFIGETEQIPPMYSALKQLGVPLYKLARKGIEVERKPRKIVIYSITDFSFIGENQYAMTVHCSKGTYIRSLCQDIGKAFNTGGTMSSLCRIMSSGIPIENCLFISDIKSLAAAGQISDRIYTAETIFKDALKADMAPSGIRYFLNGGVIDEKRLSLLLEKGVLYRVYGQGEFLGLGKTAVCENGDMGLKCIYSEVGRQ